MRRIQIEIFNYLFVELEPILNLIIISIILNISLVLILSRIPAI